MSDLVQTTINYTGEDCIPGYGTFNEEITVLGEDGEPLDLSEYEEVRVQFRTGHADDPPIFDCTNTADPYPDTGARILEPKSAGKIQIVISAEDTKAHQDTLIAAGDDPTEDGVWDALVYGGAAHGSRSSSRSRRPAPTADRSATSSICTRRVSSRVGSTIRRSSATSAPRTWRTTGRTLRSGRRRTRRWA